MFDLILKATIETLYLVFGSGVLSALFGVPLGIILYLCRPTGFYANGCLYQILNALVNTGRSIPFIILMIALIPFIRWVVGTSIGNEAAILALTIAAIPFLGRLTESALIHVDEGLIEAGLTMGGSPTQILRHIILPEAFPGLIQGITLTWVNLVGYSAMAGTIGGGGLGSLAIHHGYQRFNAELMIWTVVVLIGIVQALQATGDFLVNRRHRQTHAH